MTKLLTAVFLSTGTAVAAFDAPKILRTPSKLDASSLTVPPEEMQPVFDPLGLYPKDSPERKNGRIRPLEYADAADKESRPIVDPLNMYADVDAVDKQVDTMSRALPFVARPQHLNGSMVGDAGFDPLGLAAAGRDRLEFMRESELKHARIAMLAAAGWPVAELCHTKLAFSFGARPLLQSGDRVPSILNGGLGHIMADYWPYIFGALVLGGAIEAFTELDKRQAVDAGMQRQPGNLGFDPFGTFAKESDEGKRSLELMEIKNGRLAMLAIALFAFQEAVMGVGVVPQLINALHPHAAEFTAQELSALPSLLDRAL